MAWLRRYPAVLALLLQVLAGLLAWAVLPVVWRLTGWPLTGLALAGLQGGLAAVTGHLLGLPRWWLPISLLFMPAVVLGQQLDWPVWLPASMFALLLLANWNSLGERVPLYLSSAPAERALQQLLDPLPDDAAFIDLGSGLAGSLTRLARANPQRQFHGVESAPLVFLLGWLRSLPLANCRVRYGSLWQIDLAPYALVYCFLSPAPMPRVWDKAQAEMGHGSLLVSNSFAIPGVAPAQRIELHDWRAGALLVWCMP